MNVNRVVRVVAAWGFLVFAGGSEVLAQGGMPAEAHEAIRALLEGHESIDRVVELSDDGYVAVTESSDPELAKMLRRHVRQMEERLESGLMVRRWDPAFEEYVNHYDDIEHEVRRTEKGIRIVVRGLTPEAVKVAQNHAKVIGDFVARGWEAHDAPHPAALAGEGATPRAFPGRGRGRAPGHGSGRGRGRESAPSGREQDASSVAAAESQSESPKGDSVEACGKGARGCPDCRHGKGAGTQPASHCEHENGSEGGGEGETDEESVEGAGVGVESGSDEVAARRIRGHGREDAWWSCC